MTTIDHSGRFRLGVTDPRGIKGSARAKEVAAQRRLDAAQILEDLLSGLGRQPTAVEIVQAELIAETLVNIRKLAARSRNNATERRLLARLMKDTVFGAVPAPHPAIEQGNGRFVANLYEQNDEAHRRRALRGWVDDAEHHAEPTTEQPT